MPVDDEPCIETNAELDQHFLSNSAKIALLIEAAGIQPADHVVEAGAGIGTVAERVPSCQRLTVIEYDINLVPYLLKRVPHAQVIQGDALASLPTLRCDVLLSNLPSRLTGPLIDLLPGLDFRLATITVSSIDELTALKGSFTIDSVTVLEPDDFRPRQSAKAEIVRVARAQEHSP